MSNIQLPQTFNNEAVLGSEYCSGYFDSLKNWNNGFYCPSMEESIDVFCWGTPTHKYCCTKKDQVIQTQVESVTILIGVVVGATTALLLLTMVACICCPSCPLYKKKTPSKHRGSMYRLQQGSDHSAVTNMYSVSANGSRSTTPVPASSTSTTPPHTRSRALLNSGMSHSHTLPHSLSHHHSFRGGVEREEMERRYGTLGRQPRGQPPPYHILPRSSYLLIPQDTPDLLSGGLMREERERAVHSFHQEKDLPDNHDHDHDHDLDHDHVHDDEEELYRSTKF